MTRTTGFALALAVWFAGLLGQARADVFPDQPYNGMQLDFQLDGIVPTGFEDRETPRTVTRILEGVIAGARVRIKGTAFSVEDRAEVLLTISGGPYMKQDSLSIKPGQGHKDFSLEIGIPDGARGSHISVLINPDGAGKNGKKSLRLDVTAVPKR